jgi:PAS domain S-box-containing protein
LSLSRIPEQVAGSTDRFPLPHIVLNFLLGLVSVAAVGLLVSDVLFRFAPERIAVELGLTILVTGLYFLARFRGVFGPLVWGTSVASLVFIVANYFANGGMEGSGWIGAFLVVGLMAILHRRWTALCWGLAATGLQLVCMAIELAYPTSVQAYGTAIDKQLDLSLTFLACALTFFSLIRIVMSYYEVSVRQTAEALEQSAQSEERRRLAMAATRDGHWDWDLERGTQYHSANWKNLLGYRDDELVSEPGLAERLTPPDEWKRMAAAFEAEQARGADRVQSEFQMRHKEGHLVDILANTLILRNADGKIVRYVGTHSDITERKRTLSQLTLAMVATERANRGKSEFLASMSHELRTPLNAILGFTQLLQARGRLPADDQDLVREISVAGSHLLDLITEILDLAQVESGQITLRTEVVNTGEVLGECLSLVQALTHDKNVTLNTEVAQPPLLWADRLRVKQVLLNLLSNAIKYNVPGGRVTVSAQGLGSQVRITVSDTGIGIASDLQERLFHTFDRLGREAGEIQGSGIGLAHSRRLVSLMGGIIGFESAVGQGSRFWFDLPAAAPGLTAPRRDAVAADAVLPVSMVLSTVLSIEDHPSNRKLVAQALGDRRHLRLVEASTGTEGLRLARDERPAVVLLDLDLPDIDGFAVLRQLRSEDWGQDLPVVAVTAKASDRDRRRMADEGFDGWLTKPLDVSELQERVDSLILRGR